MQIKQLTSDEIQEVSQSVMDRLTKKGHKILDEFNKHEGRVEGVRLLHEHLLKAQIVPDEPVVEQEPSTIQESLDAVLEKQESSVQE